MPEEDSFDFEIGREVFKTPRCLAREIRLSDLPRLYEIYDGPGIKDFLEPLYEWEEEVEYTRTYIRMIYGFYGYGMWVVCDQSTGLVIGRVGFDDREIPVEDGSMRRILEFGYLIASDRQNCGLGTEVCRGALSYLFGEYEEDTVTSLIDPGNLLSIRFAERLGFSRTGETVISGKRMLVFEITKQEFLAK